MLADFEDRQHVLLKMSFRKFAKAIATKFWLFRNSYAVLVTFVAEAELQQNMIPMEFELQLESFIK